MVLSLELVLFVLRLLREQYIVEYTQFAHHIAPSSADDDFNASSIPSSAILCRIISGSGTGEKMKRMQKDSEDAEEFFLFEHLYVNTGVLFARCS